MKQLSAIIAELRQAIAAEKLTAQLVTQSTQRLAEIAPAYNAEKFPQLTETDSFVDTSGDSPANLAEALLWKMGKWNVYKSFCDNFTDDTAEPSKTNVVFYAFARHLKNPDTPIYDQHAIRSLWAICPMMTTEEQAKCRHLLMNKQGLWKETGSGSYAIDCYQIFLKYIDCLTSEDLDHNSLDRLLMPLGQAIKKMTKDYAAFSDCCSMSTNS